MLFCFPLHCNRVSITETNQSCSKRHVQPAQTVVKHVTGYQTASILDKTLLQYSCKTLSLYMHRLLIELLAVWCFYWVCCSWALSICKSYCTLHAVWNIHVLYPWQTGAVVEDTGLSVNLRSSEEQKEAEVYHRVMTVSSPQLQDTQNQASAVHLSDLNRAWIIS